MSKFMVFGDHRGAFRLYGEYESQSAAKCDVDLAFEMDVFPSGSKLEWNIIENPFTRQGVAITAWDGTCTTKFFIIEVETPRSEHELDFRINSAVNPAKAQPKGIIWDSEPETRCDCGNVCTNCGGPGHM